jgi:hypothetical protein
MDWSRTTVRLLSVRPSRSLPPRTGLMLRIASKRADILPWVLSRQFEQPTTAGIQASSNPCCRGGCMYRGDRGTAAGREVHIQRKTRETKRSLPDRSKLA